MNVIEPTGSPKQIIIDNLKKQMDDFRVDWEENFPRIQDVLDALRKFERAEKCWFHDLVAQFPVLTKNGLSVNILGREDGRVADWGSGGRLACIGFIIKGTEPTPVDNSQ